MGEQREDPELSTQGKGTPTISTSPLTSTSQLVGGSSVAPHPSTLASALGMILVSHEFF